MISMGFISALLAFLVFNWHPASIFMGDSGSLTLGFVISVLAVKSLAYLPSADTLWAQYSTTLYFSWGDDQKAET